MLSRALIVGALIISVSCNTSEGGGSIGSAGTPGNTTRPGTGSAGSFSADLAKELGPGSAVKAGSDAKISKDVGKAGSGEAAALAGSDTAKAGSDVKPDGTAKAGGDAAKAGSNAVAMAGSAVKPDTMAKTGSDAKPDAGPDPAKTGSNAIVAAENASKPDPAKADSPAGGTGVAPESHGSAKVPAALTAIKLSLLPNWDRDIHEAGTFQYVVRIKGTQSTKTFSFHYGYDDPKAPTDLEQYKKYLQDSRTLSEIKDRQRGAAWFLEGVDASGLPAFRYLVLYGGKRLICYGSLYKDAESSRLGDDRDQTVIQAKQICETLAL
ncbi:MAG TPA: hypothetical protein VHN14_18440 [Kofleriaceae bacterium]|jgi:hypothetical protein|nr:hypothetical protein [Kofleriaceae bacterium]